MTVPVRVLKDRLSEYLRRVRAGERVVVSHRGRPIAELAPIDNDDLSPEERLARLEEAGEVRRGSGAPLPRVSSLRVRRRPVSETLLADRE